MYHPRGHLIILEAMHALGPVMYEKSLYFQLNNAGNVNCSKNKSIKNCIEIIFIFLFAFD